MRTLTAIVLLLISGCAATGYVATSDPNLRLQQAYLLVAEDRPLMAEDFIRQSMEQYRNTSNLEGISEAYHSFGALYRHPAYHRNASQFNTLSDYDPTYQKSLDNYENAIQFFKKAGNEIGVVKSMVGMGMAYNDRNEKQKACEFYQKALENYNIGKANNAITSEPAIFDKRFKNMGEVIEGYQLREGCNS